MFTTLVLIGGGYYLYTRLYGKQTVTVQETPVYRHNKYPYIDPATRIHIPRDEDVVNRFPYEKIEHATNGVAQYRALAPGGAVMITRHNTSKNTMSTAYANNTDRPKVVTTV